MPHSLNPQVQTALRSFADLVKSAFGEDFLGMVLFGSQARGDASEESDVDVGVILRSIVDRRAVRDTLAELAYDVLLVTGEVIQAIAIAEDQWRSPETFSNPALLHAMKHDGIAVGE